MSQNQSSGDLKPGFYYVRDCAGDVDGGAWTVGELIRPPGNPEVGHCWHFVGYEGEWDASEDFEIGAYLDPQPGEQTK